MIMTRTILVPLTVLLVGFATTAFAQGTGRHFPLDHRQPPGVAARWNTLIQPQRYAAPQQVQVSLPSAGSLTFYQGSPQAGIVVPGSTQVGMQVGYTYRVRISDMPEFPGVELFPTIELLDRLHPPAGLETQFPVPITIEESEIRIALQDRMVTKVIYLEQPSIALPKSQEGAIHVEDLGPRANLLKAADLRGRPIAILRLGGRIPDPQAPSDEFYSRSPLVITAP